jgi:hypothetical protein
MKNILAIITLCIVNLCSAQFSVSIKTTNDFIANEAYLYKLNGSKDIIIDKTINELENKKDDFEINENFEKEFDEINYFLFLIFFVNFLLFSFVKVIFAFYHLNLVLYLTKINIKLHILLVL